MPDTAHCNVAGLPILNLSRAAAVARICDLCSSAGSCTTLYFANTHTVALAYESAAYRDIIRRGHLVLGDGIGIRTAAFLRGISMRDNLVGTDLIPLVLRTSCELRKRYFLLGADLRTIEHAAAYCKGHFLEWELCGYHHGYIENESAEREVLDRINHSRADLLLVGMGSPIQEQWLDRNRLLVNVKVAAGVGGLFEHWGGNLDRAKPWVRRLGCEWIQLCLQHQGRWRRYAKDAPLFLMSTLQSLGPARPTSRLP